MRSVFVGVGAYLGRVESETRCAFWADEPSEHGFDPSRLIHVDLARNPSSAISGDIPWDAVEVDDCFHGPGGAVLGTTLGGGWPELEIVGVVQLEQTFWRALHDNVRPPVPPDGVQAHDYEHNVGRVLAAHERSTRPLTRRTYR